MFSVCLFTGGGWRPRGTPKLGGAPGVTPKLGEGNPQHSPPTGGGGAGGTPTGGGAAQGYPPTGQKCWTTFWTKNGQNFGNFWRWGAGAVRLLRSRRRTVLFTYVFAFVTLQKSMVEIKH